MGMDVVMEDEGRRASCVDIRNHHLDQEPIVDDSPAFQAKWCGDWYVFGTLSVSLNCLFIFIHPYIPESPRWLVSGRKFEEAGNLINDIRKFNNLSEIDNLEVKLATEENESKPNVK